MKKTWLVMAVLILVLLVVSLYNPHKCFNQKGYCVYDNIPQDLKYSEPSFFSKDDGPTYVIPITEPIGDSIEDFEIIEEFAGNASEYMTRDDSPNRLSEVFSGDWESYTCVSTGESPVIVEYFYDLCEGVSFGELGCWHERRAVICGDSYLIQDFTSSYGPRLYGPFSIEN